MFIFLLLPYFVLICRLTILYTSIGTALKYVGMNALIEDLQQIFIQKLLRAFYLKLKNRRRSITLKSISHPEESIERERGYNNSQLNNSDTTTSKKGLTIVNSFSNYNNPDANSLI